MKRLTNIFQIISMEKIKLNKFYYLIVLLNRLDFMFNKIIEILIYNNWGNNLFKTISYEIKKFKFIINTIIFSYLC